MIFSLNQNCALADVQGRIADRFAALEGVEREFIGVELRHDDETMPDELGDVDVFGYEYVEGMGTTEFHVASVDLDGNIIWSEEWQEVEP